MFVAVIFKVIILLVTVSIIIVTVNTIVIVTVVVIVIIKRVAFVLTLALLGSQWFDWLTFALCIHWLTVVGDVRNANQNVLQSVPIHIPQCNGR